MEQYAMYLRKSRADQEAEARGDGETLSRHRQLLLALAKARGYSVGEIYAEIVSGESIAARPEMQRLLADVGDGKWAGVLVTEVTRLARGNSIDQGIVAQTFKYTGTKIVTPEKTYRPEDEFDEEYFEFGLFMSRREYKMINRRQQAGRRASLEQGNFIASAPVYGYKKVRRTDRRGYTLEVDEEKASFVRMIFQWYIGGEDGRPMGCPSIAKRLNSMGVPSPGGGKWPYCTVAEILRNPTYIGKIRWGQRPEIRRLKDGAVEVIRPVVKNDDLRLIDGDHPPIVDTAAFYEAQRILKNRSNAPVPKSSELKNPLAGLMVCGRCGRSMERRQNAARGGNAFLMCPNIECDMMGSLLSEVEEAVLNGVRLWLDQYAAPEAEGDALRLEITQKEQALKSLEGRLSTLKGQISRLYDLLEQGIYSTDVFLARSKELADKISAAESAINDETRGLARLADIRERQASIVPGMQRILDAYPTTSGSAAKNALLKGAIDHIIYRKSKGGRWQESDLQIDLFPRLPTTP